MISKYEKMSKSRGNVVLPEEVVYRVYELAASYEFRDESGRIIDWRAQGVWRDRTQTGFFFTDTRCGGRPVFLHQAGNPVPAALLIDGNEVIQHPQIDMYFVEATP